MLCCAGEDAFLHIGLVTQRWYCSHLADKVNSGTILRKLFTPISKLHHGRRFPWKLPDPHYSHGVLSNRFRSRHPISRCFYRLSSYRAHTQSLDPRAE